MGAASVEVGGRIHCDGAYGTVLYIGHIQGLEGTWLGVEWDDPSRGKHSGCHNNTTYFTTRLPNAGSFIKIGKADIGISCPDAIRIKYGKSSDLTKPVNYFNLPQKSGKERLVEMVGMEKIMRKQSNFANLTEVVLNNMLISSTGRNGDLGELVPHIRDLDLSLNLLVSWEDIADIVQQLPHLSTLILSQNRLKIPENCEVLLKKFQFLKTLVLNNMSYCWKEILTCATMWPYVQELSVLNNNISTLEVPPALIFSQLKLLGLDNNPLRSWSEVIKLGGLTKLEELHLDNTSLESIEFSTNSPLQKTNLFPSLRVLYVRSNFLSKWQDINELSKLRSLTDLKINNNPIVLSTNPETARQLIIAKLQGLETLNRTNVERSEKRGAELDYLKRYRSDWVKSGGSINNEPNMHSEEFVKEHPTYHLLLQRHGAAEENEVKPQCTLIKDNLICVKIFSPLTPNKPVLTRKLPAEMTVGKLKALVQRIFKVAAHEVTLTRLFKDDETKRTKLDNDLRELSFYSLSDQDKISVEW